MVHDPLMPDGAQALCLKRAKLSSRQMHHTYRKRMHFLGARWVNFTPDLQDAFESNDHRKLVSASVRNSMSAPGRRRKTSLSLQNLR